ncbi:MAG: M3 family oligoendopeptidase [Gemmatimonadales bacterium]
MRPLPDTSAGFADATWDSLAPWYRELQAAPLDAASLGAWLAHWSRLDELVTEAASLAMIAYTCDTADAAKKAAHLRFSTEILPHLEQAEVALARRFVAVGTDRPDLQTALRRFRSAIEIFREDNVPLVAAGEALAAQYQQITGTMSAEWNGERVPLPRLAPFLKNESRAIREAAWHAGNDPYVAAHDELAGVFDRMLALRQTIARNAGFRDFRDYAFVAKCRFDYTPADVARLRDAIRQHVVPANQRALEHRRVRLGLDRLRPWDLAIDPWRARSPVPYRTVDELMRVAADVFAAVDPQLGGQFGTMMAERLLDLESRPGKAPGGYCDTLHARGRPFVFMNAAGVAEDVTTLLHEAGHCFHAFASHQRPLIWQRHPGAESAELASMSMELLASPYLARPIGFYGETDAISTRLEHLEDVLMSLAHIASVDAFQDWIYTSDQGADTAARDRAWLRLREEFEPGIDWTGLIPQRIARWYRQLHIFLYPFYYIEYAIAEVGALQVWRNSRHDPAKAVSAYRRFLALGATVSLPELYRAADVTLSFDAGVISELVAMVESEMAELRGALAKAA